LEKFLRTVKTSAQKNFQVLAKSSIDTTKPFSEKVSLIMTAGLGAVGASLSEFADIPFNADQVTRITSAMKNYGIERADAVKALPQELTKFGTDVVDQFTRGGDPYGKHWSHIESQKNNPGGTGDSKNAIWEDGSKNMSRGSQNMTVQERVTASFDNHMDAFLITVRTQEFWQRTLGNAFEASVYAAAITALDMLLIHRDDLFNASTERKKEILVEILKNSGLMAAGALPVSVFLAVALMLIPGLTVVMIPLGVVGSVGLSIRLIKSLVDNPSEQEQNLLTAVQSHLQGLIYEFRRNKDGSLTIDVESLPVN